MGDHPVGAHRFLREPAEEFGGICGLAPRIPAGLAVLQRDEMGEMIEPHGHQFPRLSQHLGPFTRRARGPVGHGGLGRVKRGIGVGDIGRGDRGQHLFGGGVDHVEPFGRLVPRAVDVKIGMVHVGLRGVRAGGGAAAPRGLQNRSKG
ncbi:MAG: hypothetical protein HLUCCO07_13170 [Rhodobacteraceae bacterium HLUCCO07]|nr:MAG: hypothetical protein HLUCCO07_13170 [Rhodobacteraceae bacterium HLUCCO07]